MSGAGDTSGAGREGSDPRDVREPWSRPDLASLTPDRMMAYIRARCPWAMDHTHRTLAPYLLEESAELLAAIVEDEHVGSDGGSADAAGTGTADAVEAELADVLYQVVFHAALLDERRGAEPGATWSSLQQRLVDKYVRRHPHVFDSSSPVPIADVQRRYQDVKTAERAEEGAAREPSAAAHAEAADEALSILADIRGTIGAKNRQN
ncbi:MazG nucleotide pyrophosphohydrolase domain-containing protein [Brevibacterium jeotgali]|uniref:MazG nucleotide pyrophosphohydrolase domain-containing protein n=1 Tax=Brevibacterium jeotgali TaxID=1262550 RepID=A0A2H1L6C5_9MICO|nr:MazG nucleotide pyrophosphohydrolase domain-containing protein [Brevibacterium jeotgali]TWB99032.1 MazG-like nucleotide pyrophosphohydrolase family protein [Brevibacterium jeotgali]SMY12461.1 MazG nucleotide pyrophosphohydrolase domain-containing protein [Brevibacterium jeotgali]